MLAAASTHRNSSGDDDDDAAAGLGQGLGRPYTQQHHYLLRSCFFVAVVVSLRRGCFACAT